ncbi:VWA domain-containing protein [Chamaesiphon sp. OTE_20_metabat_361]|uniref:vWA domain-containing protein n=1 Tax=Chamaesiphon sp. OTE_20_metabat_361 TaxID=2964689 RepID=UPI00286D642F|nr:VWA domain-containing protein [Chamaesiphon sp. OTE_20_metabat_361]
MQVALETIISDPQIDISQGNNQRQLSIEVSALAEPEDRQLPLNLCLILDHSGSMKGTPLSTVKQAARELINGLKPEDRLSVVAFDHQAEVIVPCQQVTDPTEIFARIDKLQAAGGTAIDAGIKLGITQLIEGRKDRVSHAFILTDGENEHGDDDRCIKLAGFATESNITLNTLGFGENWNQNILEKIADTAAGTLAYIEEAAQAVSEFGRIFNRMQSVGLTNAYLQISLQPKVRLAELKPVAQVAPDTIELAVEDDGNLQVVRLGDLMKDLSRVILVNTYIGQLAEGEQSIATVQIRYDDPAKGLTNLLTPPVQVHVSVTRNHQPAVDENVQQQTLALAKYRQTQLAEQKLQQGDRAGAATLLQTAAKTALQMGDTNAATVLQSNATILQGGADLSEAEKKKTRMVSKTILQ